MSQVCALGRSAGSRSRNDLLIHQAKRLGSTVHQRLPVTTPLQTLNDLRGDRAWAEALFLGLVDRSEAPHEAEPTRSELERKLLASLRAAGLPRPLVNHRRCSPAPPTTRRTPPRLGGR